MGDMTPKRESKREKSMTPYIYIFVKYIYISDLGTRSFFQDLLSAYFNSMDRYRSIAHFAYFQVRSSLNRSQKTSGSLWEKSAETLDRS